LSSEGAAVSALSLVWTSNPRRSEVTNAYQNHEVGFITALPLAALVLSIVEEKPTAHSVTVEQGEVSCANNSRGCSFSLWWR
jgi:hypothetical protein